MSRAAWVSRSSFYEKDGFEIDERSTETAWVFPDGLELGRQVQYVSTESERSGFPRYGDVSENNSKTFALGEVASIDSNVVTFTWVGSVQQRNEGAWSSTSPPGGVLRMEASNDHQYKQGATRRVREEHSRYAKRHDEYQINVPSEAWELLPRQIFVVTLTSHEITSDGHVRWQLNTLSGDQFEVTFDEDQVDATIGELMKSVASARQLGPCARVSIVSEDGGILEPDQVLSR